jgi:hypothetical protein
VRAPSENRDDYSTPIRCRCEGDWTRNRLVQDSAEPARGHKVRQPTDCKRYERGSVGQLEPPGYNYESTGVSGVPQIGDQDITLRDIRRQLPHISGLASTSESSQDPTNRRRRWRRLITVLASKRQCATRPPNASSAVSAISKTGYHSRQGSFRLGVRQSRGSPRGAHRCRGGLLSQIPIGPTTWRSRRSPLPIRQRRPSSPPSWIN